MLRKISLFLLLVFTLTACSGIFPLDVASPTPTPSSTPTPVPTLTAPPPTQQSGPQKLVIWLPARFDPYAGTPAGDLLANRLNQFAVEREGLSIEVRIKTDLLKALTVTSNAAPDALPDLVALPRPDLEVAAGKGLLRSLDGLTTILDDDPDWYAYARQMAHVQNTAYGLPFAGDALALFYRPSIFTIENSITWAMFLEQNAELGFPAADPKALVSLDLYLSLGGQLVDDTGRPTLDSSRLTDLLTFYAQASTSRTISGEAVQYQTDDQAWQSYREGRTNLSVTWLSRYQTEAPADTGLLPLPGLESQPYTLATGWTWAVSGSDAAHQALATELAEYLVDSDFLAAWMTAVGYLPTRPTALTSWSDRAQQALASQVLDSAQLTPSQDLLLVLGPPLQEAVINVLQGKATPEDAAQKVLDQLK